MGSRALLLDIGGVVLRSGHEMMAALAQRRPALGDVATRRGYLGTAPDRLWDRMLAEEISEREYWRRRAADLGAAVGETWEITDLMEALYELPADELIRPEARALIAETKARGLRVGALTNDLVAFHGEHAVARHPILDQLDVLVDGSVNGVLKPDPEAYRLAVQAMGRPAADIVFLDDMPWNVAGGRAAGMIAVQVDLVEPADAFDDARELLHLGRRAA